MSRSLEVLIEGFDPFALQIKDEHAEVVYGPPEGADLGVFTVLNPRGIPLNDKEEEAFMRIGEEMMESLRLVVGRFSAENMEWAVIDFLRNKIVTTDPSEYVEARALGCLVDFAMRFNLVPEEVKKVSLIMYDRIFKPFKKAAMISEILGEEVFNLMPVGFMAELIGSSIQVKQNLRLPWERQLVLTDRGDRPSPPLDASGRWPILPRGYEGGSGKM